MNCISNYLTGISLIAKKTPHNEEAHGRHWLCHKHSEEVWPLPLYMQLLHLSMFTCEVHAKQR